MAVKASLSQNIKLFVNLSCQLAVTLKFFSRLNNLTANQANTGNDRLINKLLLLFSRFSKIDECK